MRAATKVALAGASALSLASAAIADEPGSRQTREFVQAAGESDAFEIMEAQAALAQSTDPQIRAFADAMIRAHSGTSQSLKEATDRAGLKPPPGMVGAGQAPFLAAIQNLRGRDFDKAYAEQQVLAHRSALAVQQAYATGGDNAPVRQAAAAAVPIISAHLAMAEQMKAKFGGS